MIFSLLLFPSVIELELGSKLYDDGPVIKWMEGQMKEEGEKKKVEKVVFCERE